jgi:iron complex outermembrane recepter protein
VYTRENIEESGKATVADFLNTLPEVSLQSTPDRFNTTGGQTNVQLHGFPAGTTATLLNGRRLAPSADIATAFDLNALPLAFIERIDVLPSGSSAVYGSDAIAGVVNFITKRDVSGLHLSASFGHAADYTEQNYSAAWGKSWDRGSISVVASYDTHGQLFGRDRAIVANADYRRFAAQGGTDQRTPNCHPGNVFSLTTENLPGLTSTVAAIPATVDSRPSVGDFVATQGTQNLCSTYKDFGLIPAVDREGVLVNGRYQIAGSVEAFAELLYAHAKTSFLSPLLLADLAVPASNAFNPFGTDMLVRTELAIPTGTITVKDYLRALVGLRGDLLSKWHWEIALWRTDDQSPLFAHASIQFGPLEAALASPDPTTALNPFSSKSPGSASVLAGIYPTLPNLFHFDVNVVDGVVRGKLFDMPAGPVSFAIGGEYQWQTYFNDPRSLLASLPVTDVSRQVGAVYSELRLPILGPRAGGGDLLDLTLAGRYDHYNDFGSKATPQAGIEVRPIDGLLLRASYAQAFKAPLLTQLHGSQFSFQDAPFPDNGRPGNPITSNVSEIVGGNPNLRAETGNAYSLGVVWSGRGARGLKASFDYWWLGEDNRISNPTIAAVLGNPDIYPGRTVRDASGVLLLVDTSAANFGALRAEGFDLDLKYGFTTAWGEFTTSAAWVMTTKFMAAVTPGAPLINRLGQATLFDAWAVKNKASLGLGWREGRYFAHATARYLGSYRDYETTPANTNRLGDYALFDLSGGIDLSNLGRSKYLKHAALTASVVNLFDKSPQYSNALFGNGYDTSQADILGRVARVGLTLDW